MTTTTGETPAADSPPTFDLLPLTPEVRRAIDELGWLTPTPVQLAAYAPASEGTDLVVQARTGTGKTAAFGLPLIDRRVRPENKTQVLVLAPTRELALQSARELERIGRHRGIRTSAVYGGAPMDRQIRELQEGAQIVSGTPGRVLDHLRRGSLVVEDIRTLVLDEADEMLSMGFAKELHAIVEMLPKNRQTMLFSATLDDAIQRLAQKFLKDPVQLSLSSDQVGAQTISHFVYLVSGLGKAKDLIRILEVDDPESAILFCNTKAVTEQVAAELQAAGLDADWLNGDLPQSDREKVLERTRKGKLRYLVATDVAARGIDISHVTHVVNYDFPVSLEQYVHRTGRTGRAGRTGTAISLITPTDLGQLYYLRLQFKIFPIERVLPSAGEVKARGELDRIEMIRAAFADFGGTGQEGLRAIARRVLTHDDAESIVAGLVGAFMGAHGTDAEVEEQAAAARRARPARPVTLKAEEPAKEARTEAPTPREPRAREPREQRERESRPTREPREARVDAPRAEAPRIEARAPEAPVEGTAATEPDAEGEARRRRRRERPEGEAPRAPSEARSEARTVRDVPSRELPPREPREAREPRPEEDPNFSTLFLNIGRREGVRVGDVLRLFEDRAALTKDQLGRIRIRDRHTFVGIAHDQVARVLESLAGARFGERELVAEVARAEKPVEVTETGEVAG